MSGYCTLVYGHVHCSPGPVLVDGIEVLPRSCYCACHGKPKKGARR
ncbi:hypothetical protein [Streptomyces filamentosus]|nr:hypothetical protein [Streptomyces filamentosus]